MENTMLNILPETTPGVLVEGPKEYTGNLFNFLICPQIVILDAFQRVLLPLEN
jgi:hypothetical protein